MSSLFPRSSGVLLHPTSLPGPYGIGDLGPAAYEFLDFLEAGGQSIWQMLPLGPTGYGDSPYQCFSAFAGNPLLISLDELASQGLLSERDLDGARLGESAHVDFPAVIAAKTRALNRAARGFYPTAEFRAFCSENDAWLGDYALFMALKEAFGMTTWQHWPVELRCREASALDAFRADHSERIQAHTFFQFAFFGQWSRLRAEARRRGIRLMGDVPIYAAGDSSDVWAQNNLWLLREDGNPAQMAGVPPDYFSATGQLWGNPIYNWAAHEGPGMRGGLRG